MRIQSACFVILLLSLIACRKDKGNNPHDGNTSFVIKLSPGYLGSNQVDSAIVLWDVNGIQQRVSLLVRNDSLIASMKDFTAGAGEMQLFIYSNKKYNDLFKGQWETLPFHLEMNHQAYFLLAGPKNFNDNQWWWPRVRVADIAGAGAIVALHPDDPYFYVFNPGYAFTEVTLERSYWQTVGGFGALAAQTWRCTTNCINRPDDFFFRELREQLGNHTWQRIEIMIIYSDAQGARTIVFLQHDI